MNNKSLIFILILSLSFAYSFAQSQSIPQTKSLTIGVIDELNSTILSEKRTLNIYLPDGYNANDTARYPVVYLLDGGLDEDFIHITGLYQFNSFPWINRVKPSIIVGITNKLRRKDMTFPSTVAAEKKNYPEAGHSDQFIKFIAEELQPYIQKKYKTTASKTLIGESLGGLLATEILFKHPTLFTKYIIVSPSLWWNNGSMLNEIPLITPQTFQGETKVYIGVGKEGVMPGNPPHVMEVDANVLADKLMSLKNDQLKVYFDYLPAENHATIMHQAVFNAILQLK